MFARHGWCFPLKPFRVTFRYFMYSLLWALILSSFSWKAVIFVITVSLNTDLSGASLCRHDKGSSSWYICAMCLMLMAHVLLFSEEVVRRYFTIWWVKVNCWVGADLPRVRKDLRAFLWKIERGVICWVLRANEYSPDLRMGQVNVRNRCILTTGLSMHLYA